MNSTTTHSGLSSLISKLESQKEELAATYHSAIKAGEKLECVKTLYITLQDINKRLRDLTSIHSLATP